jgi:methyltransferase family protein
MSPLPHVTSDPRLDLLGLINGFQITQAIHVASTLRVADYLNDGARSASELAALTKSHPDSLYRLLRALAAVGVFREDEGRKFGLTPMGDCLRRSGRGRKSSGVPIFGKLGVICCTASRRARTPFKI